MNPRSSLHHYDTPHELVMHWHKTYNVPIGDFKNPWFAGTERMQLRMELIREEMLELEKAVADPDGPLTQYCEGEPDFTETVDALGDLVYVIYGMAIEMGVNLDAILAEIQRSNMSKLGEDGQPIYREDGKVLKGPNFREPDFSGILRTH